VLSRREREYLLHPERFSRSYARVLRHQIRMKIARLVEDLRLLQGHREFRELLQGLLSLNEPLVEDEELPWPSRAEFEAWLRGAQGYSPRTAHSYGQTLDLIRRRAGRLRREAIEELLAGYRNPKSRNHLVCVLRRAADYLELQGYNAGWLRRFRLVKAPKVYPKELPTWSEVIRFYQELQKLCEAPPPGLRHRHHIAQRDLEAARVSFLGLLSSGWRLWEWLNLTPELLDPETRMLRPPVRYSDETKRTWASFLTREAMRELQAYMEAYPPQETIFLLKPGRAHYGSRARKLQRVYKIASRRTGIRIHAHLLRSINGFRMGLAGIPDRYVNAFQGRASQDELARHYSDYRPKILRALHLIAQPLLVVLEDPNEVRRECLRELQPLLEDREVEAILIRLGLHPLENPITTTSIPGIPLQPPNP